MSGSMSLTMSTQPLAKDPTEPIPEDSYKSWPPAPTMDMKRLTSPTGQEKKNYFCLLQNCESPYNTSNTVKLKNLNIDCLPQRSMQPNQSQHNCQSVPDDKVHLPGVSKWEEEESGIMSLNSTVSKDVSPCTKRDCQAIFGYNGRQSLASDFSHVTDILDLSRDKNITLERNRQHLSHEHLLSTHLPSVTQELATGPCNRVGKEQQISPSSSFINKLSTHVMPTSKRQTGEMLEPDLRVYGNNLQVILLEQQQKILQSNDLIAHLSEKLLEEQKENAQLKDENFYLRSLFCPKDSHSFRTRGTSSSGNSLTNMSCLPLSMKSFDDGDKHSTRTGSRCAVENSDLQEEEP